MKKMRRFFTGLAAAAMMVSLVMPVQAADYNYSFRLLPGVQGIVEGPEAVVEFDDTAEVKFERNSVSDNNPYGGKVTVAVAGKESKTYEISISKSVEDAEIYYVKGIRKGGRDQILADEEINKDADYVVAYGVMKNPVKYTVYYRDAASKANLLQPQEFWGSVGEKPVVACQDIDGYIPNAKNETMTLKANAAENNFYFDYYPIPASAGGVVTDRRTETVTNPVNVIVPGETGNAEAGGDAAGAAGGGVTVVPGDGDAADAGAGAGAGDAGEAAAPTEPEELVDLDDEEVPLANVPGSNGGGLGIGSEPGSFFVNMPPAVIVGVVSMAVLVVAAAWYLIFKRKNKGTGEDGQE